MIGIPALSFAIPIQATDRDHMSASFEETIISVWRQALIENSQGVVLDGRRFSVGRTSRSKLREIDFEFEGETFRGLEQNPDTKSRGRSSREKGRRLCNS